MWTINEKKKIQKKAGNKLREEINLHRGHLNKWNQNAQKRSERPFFEQYSSDIERYIDAGHQEIRQG